MHRRPWPQSPHEFRSSGDLELAGGVAKDNVVSNGIEKLAASDRTRARARRLLQMTLVSIDYVFEIGYGS